jgi:8-oxo-dGTP pyrophosphatase MutT (NUDIX family)
VRELREETGLEVARLYAIAVQPFFMRPVRTVQLAIAFAAFVDDHADIVLGPEHQAHAWLTVEQALARYVWPQERNTLQQIVQLLGDGDAGPVEDVLRVF